MSNKRKAPSFELNSFTNIFSTPSVVTGPAGVPWYETLNGQDSVDMVYEYGQKAGEAFVGMGYFLKRIRDNALYKELGYNNMAELAKEKFNMEESAVSRLVNLCEKYSENNNSPVLDVKYKEYNQSQLIEMLSIKDEEVLNEITPDTTVKEIREIKKRGLSEPSDAEIKDFFNKELRHQITSDEWADLKNYLSKHFRHKYCSISNLKYQGSLRGIQINQSEEITWAKLVGRIYLLEDLVPDCIKKQSKQKKTSEDVQEPLPGQMHIESDFPQYCPDNTSTEDHNHIPESDNQNCDIAILDKSSVEQIENIKFPAQQTTYVEGDFRVVSEEPITTEVVEKEDVMIKYRCCSCQQQFILGELASVNTKLKTVYCPYCGSVTLEEFARVSPGEIEELGPLAIWTKVYR